LGKQAEVVEIAVKLNARQYAAELAKMDGKTDKATKGMQKGFLGMDKTGSKLTKTMIRLAGPAALGLLARQMVVLGRNTANTVAILDDQAKKLGVTTQFLQETQFAAKAVGIEANTLGMALQRLERRSAEAAHGTGEAKDALAELGIELRDKTTGAIRGAEEIFDDVMKALGGVNSEADRLRLGFKLFDSEGAALVTMADRYEALRNKAAELGLAFSTETIDKAKATREEFLVLSEVIKVNLTPAILEMAEAMAKAGTSFATSTASAANFFGAGGIGELNDSNLKSLLEQRQRGAAFSLQHLLKLSASEKNRGIAAGPGGIAESLIGGSQAEQVLRLQSGVAEVKAEMARREAKANADALKRKSEAAAKALAPQLGPGLAFQEGTGTDASKELRGELAGGQLALGAFGARGSTPSKEQRDQFFSFGGFLPEEYQEQWEIAIAAKETAEEESVAKMVEVSTSAWQEMGSTMLSSVTSNFAQMVVTGEGSFKQLSQSFQVMFVDQAMNALLSGVFGGGGGVFGGLFGGGGKAAGGPVSANVPYIVGERRPEVFVPNVSGTILPSVGGGGGGGMNVVIHNNTPAKVAAQETIGVDGRRELAVMIDEVVVGSITNGRIGQQITEVFGASRQGVKGDY